MYMPSAGGVMVRKYHDRRDTTNTDTDIDIGTFVE